MEDLLGLVGGLIGAAGGMTCEVEGGVVAGCAKGGSAAGGGAGSKIVSMGSVAGTAGAGGLTVAVGSGTSLPGPTSASALLRSSCVALLDADGDVGEDASGVSFNGVLLGASMNHAMRPMTAKATAAMIQGLLPSGRGSCGSSP